MGREEPADVVPPALVVPPAEVVPPASVAPPAAGWGELPPGMAVNFAESIAHLPLHFTQTVGPGIVYAVGVGYCVRELGSGARDARRCSD